MKRLIFLVLSAGLALSGCTSSSTSSDMAVIKLTDGGAQISILASEAVAQQKSCTTLGQVIAPPPYILPDDARNTLRNRAAELGADSMFVTNYMIAPATATAYRCKTRS